MWTATGCRPSASDTPTPQHGQFPLPTKLGISIQEVRRAASATLPGHEALDEEDRWVARGSQWRSHDYTLSPEAGLGVSVIYRYRAEDEKVWLISVRNAAGRYAGRLGPVDFNTKVAYVEASLGSPRSGRRSPRSWINTSGRGMTRCSWSRRTPRPTTTSPSSRAQARSGPCWRTRRSSAHPASWDTTRSQSARSC